MLRGANDNIFRNKKVLLAYRMDAHIVLSDACCAFRNFFLKLVKKDPFVQAITISSISNKVFRFMFRKHDTLGITLRRVTIRDTTSLMSLFNGWRTLITRGTI